MTLNTILVYAVAGLLLVVGGVQVNDETDRVWSEALFALTRCSSNQQLIKVTRYTIYQGTKVPPHRYLQYTNIDLYTIHIASKSKQNVYQIKLIKSILFL